MFLKDDHGVAPSDVVWVRAGDEDPNRIEKIAVRPPTGVRLENAPSGKTISAMLAAGELDAVIGPRAPHAFAKDIQTSAVSSPILRRPPSIGSSGRGFFRSCT